MKRNRCRRERQKFQSLVRTFPSSFFFRDNQFTQSAMFSILWRRVAHPTPIFFLSLARIVAETRLSSLKIKLRHVHFLQGKSTHPRAA